MSVLKESSERALAAPDASFDWLHQNLRSSYEAALGDHGPYEYQFNICGQMMRFSFVEEGLATSLTRAFAHLRQPLSVVPDCTVEVGESKSSNRFLPLLVRAYLSALEYGWWNISNPRGELLEIQNPPAMAAYYPGTSGLSLLDIETGRGLYWKTNLAHLPYYEAGYPFRTLLHWWLRSRGFQFVHGAAVGTDSGAVLLVGKGGAGKSTSAMAAIRGGLRYAGDDYCAVGLDPEPTVYSLYNACKLCGDDDLARFPGAAAHVSNPTREPDEKAVFFLYEHFPEKVSASLPLKAILVPKITGAPDTAIRPCKGTEAFAAIVPGTMAQLPSSHQGDLKFMSALVRRLPTYSLELGSEVEQIPVVIANLLELLA